MQQNNRNKTAVILGIFLLAASAGRGAPPAQPQPGLKFYQDTTNYEGVGIQILVNGLPVFSDKTSGQGSGGELLNPYLLNETNHLTIILTALPGKPVPSEQARAEEQVLEASQGAGGTPGPTQTVYRYEWKQKAPPGPLPAPITGTLPPAQYAQPLNWQNAPRTPLTAADRAEIDAQINLLHAALAAKDRVQAAKLLRAKTDNMARALGQPVAELEASQQRFFESEFRNPQWRLKPIRYAQLQFHSGAGGRVVYVLNPDGSDPLSSLPTSGNGATAIPAYLARIEGHWEFVL